MLELENPHFVALMHSKISREGTGQESSMDAKLQADFDEEQDICMSLKCILTDCLFVIKEGKVCTREIGATLYTGFY